MILMKNNLYEPPVKSNTQQSTAVNVDGWQGKNNNMHVLMCIVTINTNCHNRTVNFFRIYVLKPKHLNISIMTYFLISLI